MPATSLLPKKSFDQVTSERALLGEKARYGQLVEQNATLRRHVSFLLRTMWVLCLAQLLSTIFLRTNAALRYAPLMVFFIVFIITAKEMYTLWKQKRIIKRHMDVLLDLEAKVRIYERVRSAPFN